MARNTTTAQGGGPTERARSARSASAPKTSAPGAAAEVEAEPGCDADLAESAEAPASRPQRAASTPTNWRPRFLAHLGETSNVTAAALHARVSPAIVYKHRRTDPDFRAAWFAALAEGYDNLEMELLQHLRAVETGGEEGGAAPPAKKRAFDTATAFRCLAAHRDSVRQEKGRRALDHEVATIASINEKIDRLRLNAKAADKAIVAARRTNRERTRAAPEGGEDGGQG